MRDGTHKGIANGQKFEAILIDVCIAAATSAVAILHPTGSFVLYCFYIVAFQFLFLRCQAHLVEECPQEMVGTVATYQYAAMYSAMLLAMATGFISSCERPSFSMAGASS